MSRPTVSSDQGGIDERAWLVAVHGAARAADAHPAATMLGMARALVEAHGSYVNLQALRLAGRGAGAACHRDPPGPGRRAVDAAAAAELGSMATSASAGARRDHLLSVGAAMTAAYGGHEEVLRWWVARLPVGK